MKTMSPEQAVAQWDDLLETVQHEPVTIEENGRKRVVLVSIETAKEIERFKKENKRKR